MVSLCTQFVSMFGWSHLPAGPGAKMVGDDGAGGECGGEAHREDELDKLHGFEVCQWWYESGMACGGLTVGVGWSGRLSRAAYVELMWSAMEILDVVGKFG